MPSTHRSSHRSGRSQRHRQHLTYEQFAQQIQAFAAVTSTIETILRDRHTSSATVQAIERTMRAAQPITANIRAIRNDLNRTHFFSRGQQGLEVTQGDWDAARHIASDLLREMNRRKRVQKRALRDAGYIPV